MRFARRPRYTYVGITSGDAAAATILNRLNGGTFPFTATVEETHFYSVAGTYDLKVVVRDDDGGNKELLVVIVIG